MYRFFDYLCTNTECHHVLVLKEIMIGDDEDLQNCVSCGKVLEQQYPCPKGYVKGTSNYTRC